MDCFPFESFSPLQVRFLTIFSLLFCKCCSGLGSSFLPGNFAACKIFAACENSQVHYSSPLAFRLLQTLRFLCPPLISLSFLSSHLPPPPPPYSLYKSLFLFFFFFISHPISSFCSPPPPFFSFSGFSTLKTCGGSAFRPRVRCSSPPPTCGSSAATPASAALAAALLVAAAPHVAAQGSATVVSSNAAPTPR